MALMASANCDCCIHTYLNAKKLNISRFKSSGLNTASHHPERAREPEREREREIESKALKRLSNNQGRFQLE